MPARTVLVRSRRQRDPWCADSRAATDTPSFISPAIRTSISFAKLLKLTLRSEPEPGSGGTNYGFPFSSMATKVNVASVTKMQGFVGQTYALEQLLVGFL